MIKMYFMTGLLLCGFMHTAWAEETAGPWKTRSIEAGALLTSGNTDTRQLNAAGNLQFDTTTWGFGLKASATTASDRGNTTAQHYDAQAEIHYNINTRLYLFVMADYERDPFSSIDFQLSESIGAGYHAVLAPPLSLDIEIGAGIRQTKTQNTLQVSDTVGRFALQLKWAFNEHVSLAENINIEGGQQGTVSNTETALVAKINSHLSSKVSFKTRTNSKPALGIKKTDTQTAVLLTYSF